MFRFEGISGLISAAWRSTGLFRKNCAHPALLEIARDNLERWTLMQSRSQPYWDAWREILRRPLPEILDLLGEESERMTALRQATPFAGVLEPKERWAIYARFWSTPFARSE